MGQIPGTGSLGRGSGQFKEAGVLLIRIQVTKKIRDNSTLVQPKHHMLPKIELETSSIFDVLRVNVLIVD